MQPGRTWFLLIDLPPGTGDIHLSIIQEVPVTGAVIVSTPQHVALADVRKGIAMFQMESINIPVLGLIENMAYFTPEELPENKYYIFGKQGAQYLAEDLGIPVLGKFLWFRASGSWRCRKTGSIAGKFCNCRGVHGNCPKNGGKPCRKKQESASYGSG